MYVGVGFYSLSTFNVRAFIFNARKLMSIYLNIFSFLFLVSSCLNSYYLHIGTSTSNLYLLGDFFLLPSGRIPQSNLFPSLKYFLDESSLSFFWSNINSPTWFLKLICCACLIIQIFTILILNSIFLYHVVYNAPFALFVVVIFFL